jgi:transposase
LEDNDPKHTSEIAQNWRSAHGIQRIDCSPYSPDVNPKENIWAILKANVAQHKHKSILALRK